MLSMCGYSITLFFLPKEVLFAYLKLLGWYIPLGPINITMGSVVYLTDPDAVFT